MNLMTALIYSIIIEFMNMQQLDGTHIHIHTITHTYI